MDSLAVCTLQAKIKSSKNFPGDFEVNQRLRHLHGEAKENMLKNQNSEVVGVTTNETFLVNCNQLESCKGLLYT